MSNPIGLCLCKLMLCSVFALLPYPHKAGAFNFLRQHFVNQFGICILIRITFCYPTYQVAPGVLQSASGDVLCPDSSLFS